MAVPDRPGPAFVDVSSQRMTRYRYMSGMKPTLHLQTLLTTTISITTMVARKLPVTSASSAKQRRDKRDMAPSKKLRILGLVI